LAKAGEQSFATRFRNTAIAVIAFVATCAGIHALLPEPEITGVSSKLRYYEAHKDEFDVVFIGTSRVYHQIAPEIFDRTLSAEGMPVRSFNLGVSGMHPPESFLLIERFLTLRPTKLKWVFIEFEEVEARWDQERRGTQRLLYWHNWRLTSMAIRKAVNATGEEPPTRVLGHCWKARTIIALHLKLFVQNLANVGRSSDLNDLFSEDRDPNEEVHELGARRDGYRSAGEPMPAEKVVEYANALAATRKHVEPRVIDPYAEQEYREAAKAIRRFGAVPVFLLPPKLPQTPLHFRKSLPEPGEIMAFNDAAAYPQLYDPAVRFDPGHLSRAGAEEFTEIFAHTFAAEVRAGKLR
jgi:hypothetical protein